MNTSTIARATTFPSGTGLKGSGVPNIIARFFGDLNQWPITQSGFYSLTRDKITAIAEHINKTGDCLWHAEFVVMGWDRCNCAKCVPPAPSDHIPLSNGRSVWKDPAKR